MPSLIVDLFGKLLFHKSTIRTLGPLAAATLVQCDDAFGNAKFFAANSMVVLAIVTGIGKHSLKVYALVSLQQSRYKFRRIVAGTTANNAAGKQICIGMADYRYFRPATA
jgi:hypothetical protein